MREKAITRIFSGLMTAVDVINDVLRYRELGFEHIMKYVHCYGVVGQ
jgi:hypothetical protein